jgi:cytochrome c-type biogenesis protein CcmH
MSLAAILFAAATAAAPLALDPGEEARAQQLEREIRCLACENEPISQSTAEIAQDMRGLVRERVAAGDSDAEIREFFRERYGDFVLLRPPVSATTYALWITPFALLLIGAGVVWSLRRRQPDALEPELDER